MPRLTYFGRRLDFSRVTSKPADPDGTPTEPTEPTELLRVNPELTLVDPNAEPLVIKASIPDYGDESAPLREIHLVALPTGTDPGDAEQLLSNAEHRSGLDVTNVKASDVSIEMAGLPDGSWFLQAVLVAGSD